MKKGIIKGSADRGRALCDDNHLEDELKNVEDVFKELKMQECGIYRGNLKIVQSQKKKNMKAKYKIDK